MGAARREAAKLDPFAAGAYVNTLNDEGAAGVRRAYSEAKLARLTAVKDAYDPDNVFHLNHNITPTRRLSESRPIGERILDGCGVQQELETKPPNRAASGQAAGA